MAAAIAGGATSAAGAVEEGFDGGISDLSDAPADPSEGGKGATSVAGKVTGAIAKKASSAGMVVNTATDLAEDSVVPGFDDTAAAIVAGAIMAKAAVDGLAEPTKKKNAKKAKKGSKKGSSRKQTNEATSVVSIPSPLGLTFRGEDKVITKLMPGGNAEATGKVSQGMKIVSVNNNPVEGLAKKEVAALIKTSPGDCVLELSAGLEATGTVISDPPTSSAKNGLKNSVKKAKKKSTKKKKKKKANTGGGAEAPEETGVTFVDFVDFEAPQLSQQPEQPSTRAGSSPEFAVGDKVTVKGYDCEGTVRFVGNHAIDGKPKIGVELDEPVGKSKGTAYKNKGTAYFDCKSNCGVLVGPSKVAKSEVGVGSSMEAQMAAMEAEMGGFEESAAMFDAAALEPEPEPELDQQAVLLAAASTIHEWLDIVEPGYGEKYADIFESLGLEDAADMQDADIVDETCFEELVEEGVDEEAIEMIKAALGFEGGDDF